MKHVRHFICDIDGVLADAGKYAKHAEAKEWEKFWGSIPYFRPIHEGVHLLKSLKEGELKPIFVTARSEVTRNDTTKWLMRILGFGCSPEVELYMRNIDDLRPAHEVKEMILVKQLINEVPIMMAIDDDPDVCNMYRKHNIPTLEFKLG